MAEIYKINKNILCNFIFLLSSLVSLQTSGWHTRHVALFQSFTGTGVFFLIALNALSTISELHIQNKLNAISLQKSRKEGRGLAGVFIIKYERLCSFINIRQFHVEQNLGPEILVGNSSFFSHLRQKCLYTKSARHSCSKNKKRKHEILLYPVKELYFLTG